MLSVKFEHSAARPSATAAFSFTEKEKTKRTKSKKPKACRAGRPDEINCLGSLIHVIISWFIFS
uniref:Uncharacterized protein n=1 Tax=Rhinopithecus roxellana TaxID=61622 RepID=A0A2K6PVX2_RHIRO